MNAPERARLAERVLVLFATQLDSRMCQRLLMESGMECALCADLHQLGREFQSGGALAIALTEEVLATPEAGEFPEILVDQPPWSDIPVLVLTPEGRPSPSLLPMQQRINNLVLLSRPIQADAFLTAVRSAARARHRQYQIRDYLIQREQAEQGLRESEARFRALVMASSEVMYRMNPDWSEMRQLHGGQFIVDITGPSQTWLEQYIPPEDQPKVSAAIQAAIRNKSVFELEHRVLRADGTVGWTSSRAVPLLDARGDIYEWFGTASDITERKSAEAVLCQKKEELESMVMERTLQLQQTIDKLDASLKNEMILRREVHHRVKNNLQIVISILFLQSLESTDPKTQEILRECQSRTKSIALLYATLSESTDLTKIALDQYVRQLTGGLLSAYEVSLGRIKLNVQCGQISLGVDSALPCGLIITELVSNSLKHAFPGESNGEIEIVAHAIEGGSMVLSVRDNGIGLGSEFNLEGSRTMGIKIVRDLAKQLGGTLDFRTENGTRVTVTFPTRSD